MNNEPKPKPKNEQGSQLAFGISIGTDAWRCHFHSGHGLFVLAWAHGASVTQTME